MELATILIYAIRVMLPIILFALLFWRGNKKEEIEEPIYSRERLLSHWKYVKAHQSLEDVPDTVLSLTLKDATEAPELFGGASKAPGSRAPAPSIRREDRTGSGPLVRKKEPREPRRTERRAAEDHFPTPAKVAAAELVATEEKMHMESLLNYVAFNRKEPQRVFLVDEENPPPPPPRPFRSAPGEDGGAAKRGEPPISGQPAENANKEAQMVLRGALKLKEAPVAKDLYQHLVSSHVEIAEKTFVLMIEACLHGKDLKNASDFLMKMEASGYSPSSELLDKVMDLYAIEKQRKEQEKLREKQQKEVEMQQLELAAAAATSAAAHCLGAGPDEISAELPSDEVPGCSRVKLSSLAAPFVPGGAPPMPEPGVAPDAFAMGVPAMPLLPATPVTAESAEPQASMSRLPQRTKLTTGARPFEPKFGMSFEPCVNMWAATPVIAVPVQQIMPAPAMMAVQVEAPQMMPVPMEAPMMGVPMQAQSMMAVPVEGAM